MLYVFTRKWWSERRRTRDQEDKIFGALSESLEDLKNWKRNEIGSYSHKKDNVQVYSGRRGSAAKLAQPQDWPMPRRWRKIIVPKLDVLEYSWEDQNCEFVYNVVSGKYPYHKRRHSISKDLQEWIRVDCDEGYFLKADVYYFTNEEIAMAAKLKIEG